MIVVRTLIDTQWWYLFLDQHHDPIIYPRLDGVWEFHDRASADRVIKHLANVEKLKQYRFEVHEMNIIADKEFSHL